MAEGGAHHPVPPISGDSIEGRLVLPWRISMPANLTPEYEKAEQRFRQATNSEEQAAALQAMLAAIPKHKGTEKMQAGLRRRLSQLRREQ